MALPDFAQLARHPYQGATATHTVTTPYGRFQVCRACYVECLGSYPGVNSIATPQPGRLDGRCQCERDRHFLGGGA